MPQSMSALWSQCARTRPVEYQHISECTVDNPRSRLRVAPRRLHDRTTLRPALIPRRAFKSRSLCFFPCCSRRIVDTHCSRPAVLALISLRACALLVPCAVRLHGAVPGLDAETSPPKLRVHMQRACRLRRALPTAVDCEPDHPFHVHVCMRTPRHAPSCVVEFVVRRCHLATLQVHAADESDVLRGTRAARGSLAKCAWAAASPMRWMGLPRVRVNARGHAVHWTAAPSKVHQDGVGEVRRRSLSVSASRRWLPGRTCRWEVTGGYVSEKVWSVAPHFRRKLGGGGGGRRLQSRISARRRQFYLLEVGRRFIGQVAAAQDVAPEGDGWGFALMAARPDFTQSRCWFEPPGTGSYPSYERGLFAASRRLLNGQAGRDPAGCGHSVQSRRSTWQRPSSVRASVGMRDSRE